MRVLPALAVLALLAAPLTTARPHSGEYRPPLPPPRVQDDPVPGVPNRNVPTAPGGGEVTPPTEGGTLPAPVPTLPGGATRPRLGVGRDDARMTPAIWWEMSRHRFLPPLPELPLREEISEILLDALGVEDEGVRDGALLALGKVGVPESPGRAAVLAGEKFRESTLGALVALGLLGDSSSAPHLKKVASDGEAPKAARCFAALALGLSGNPEHAAFLREAADEEWEPHVRTAAVLGLGLLGDPASVETLGRILLGIHPLASPETAAPGDPKALVGLRCTAAWALGQILTPRAYDYLIEALEGAEAPVRGAAALVLAPAPGTAGLPALLRALGEDQPIQVRQFVLVSLAERGNETALAEAEAILTAPVRREQPVAPFAALALGLGRKEEHLPLLVATLLDRSLEEETRAAAALALGLGGYRGAIKPLEKLLATEKRPRVASWGVVADALLKGPAARDLALRLISDSDLPAVRRDAVTALGLLRDPEDADLLVELLGDSYHVNREAARALAHLDPARAGRELTKKLQDPNPFACRFAAFSLGVLLDRRPPGRITELVSRTNLLAGAPLVKACLYLDNEYLYLLVRKL